MYKSQGIHGLLFFCEVYFVLITIDFFFTLVSKKFFDFIPSKFKSTVLFFFLVLEEVVISTVLFLVLIKRTNFSLFL
jgi:hypothetical protein